uniref:Small ribosomal subunit protein uS3c n=1 Tax=Characiochloris acuminata TaxID=167768 RepID=A0A0S2LPU6_9CHLO|nr:ribosomal protein S3 [Characiochloris acuminata]ALO63315.1 ribosomal protein S3 [Characiochloris acuminata]
MGQKVHPLGFRVGITKKHQSQWFARFNKFKYSQSVLEDTMLRKTLMNLFPQLLSNSNDKFSQSSNSSKMKKGKRDDEITLTPRITQIKIERGLIPYEIGIQIHAENCDLLKSSINNLKINRDLVFLLQKTRRYLQHLRQKTTTVSSDNNSLGFDTITSTSVSTEKQTKNAKTTKNKYQKQRFGAAAGTRLTKQQIRFKRLIRKRFKKRQTIHRKYQQLINKFKIRSFLRKKGTKIERKILFKRLKGRNIFEGGSLRRTQKTKKLGSSNANLLARMTTPKGRALRAPSNIFRTRVLKKFATIYVNKMNHKFLNTLKSNMKSWHELMQNSNEKTYTALGTSRKWSLNRLNSLETKSTSSLTKLVTVLEQKCLLKMQLLKKEFLTLGSVAKIHSFGYYQMVTFLKHLKELVNKIKRKQKLQFAIMKLNRSAVRSNESSLSSSENQGERKKRNYYLLKKEQNVFLSTVLNKKLNNIEDECRKIQLIEYLKQIVKKHRTENIYFYLSTIADARKDLRKIKQFTKKHAAFLFGLNLTNNNEQNSLLTEKVKERVSRVLLKNNNKEVDKTLQDIYLEQIEKQRTMYKENAQLTPKITIQFYSVKEKSLKAKASVVSDSIVDALEKRKAFRKVIKDAKEELMRTPGVKGVKIQVSGRLNGAEIARSEWVRAGRVPLQTLRANLDYSYKTASTIYGIIGVKVWIFKGYTKLIN